MDEKDEEIEVINSELSLTKALGMIFGGLFLLGLLAFGGLKFYKSFKSSSDENIELKKLAETNVNTKPYVEELTADLNKKVPAPKNLNLPPPNTVKAKVGVVSVIETVGKEELKEKLVDIQKVKEESEKTETLLFNSLGKEELKKKLVDIQKVKEESEKAETLLFNSFNDLEMAIENKIILLSGGKVMIRNKSYKVNDEFGSFVIKKIYNNGNVKFYNKDEKYSRRFSL